MLHYAHIVSHTLMQNKMHFLHLFIHLLENKCLNIILGATLDENKGSFT